MRQGETFPPCQFWVSEEGILSVVALARHDAGKPGNLDRGVVGRTAQACREMGADEAALVEGIATGILSGTAAE